MGIAAFVENAVDTLIDFGTIVKTVLGSNKSVEAEVKGAGDSETTGEDTELWGLASVLERPLADAEVLFMRNGDELIGIATKDRRWQIDLSEGDVVIRAFGNGTPYIHLKADGDCVLLADNVKIESSLGAASEGIGLGDAIKTWMDNMKTVFDTHTHIYVAPPSGTNTATATALPVAPTPGQMASSKHNVEP